MKKKKKMNGHLSERFVLFLYEGILFALVHVRFIQNSSSYVKTPV